jgi:hypothetical protein
MPDEKERLHASAHHGAIPTLSPQVRCAMSHARRNTHFRRRGHLRRAAAAALLPPPLPPLPPLPPPTPHPHRRLAFHCACYARSAHHSAIQI